MIKIAISVIGYVDESNQLTVGSNVVTEDPHLVSVILINLLAEALQNGPFSPDKVTFAELREWATMVLPSAD